MNKHKILEQAFKEYFCEEESDWETELSDFEYVGCEWYEAVLIALKKASEGPSFGSWQCISCGRVYPMSVTLCPHCKPFGKTVTGTKYDLIEQIVTGYHKTNF